jgi:hypothetical protein
MQLGLMCFVPDHARQPRMVGNNVGALVAAECWRLACLLAVLITIVRGSLLFWPSLHFLPTYTRMFSEFC